MPTNLDLVKGTYDAFERGDIDSLVETFAADITWIDAEGGPYGGTYQGADEILQGVIGPIAEEWDEFRVEPERYIDGGDTVVATGTYNGTYSATGERFEAPFAHVWDVEDGEIVRFQQYIDTVLHNEPLE